MITSTIPLSAAPADRAAFGGVIPPVITPLTPDNQVDVASLARVIDRLLAAGVRGLLMLGTCGEAAALTDAQRRLVLQVAVGQARGQVPVLAGVIDMMTGRVIEHVRVARLAGVAAVVATAPFYGPTHPEEIRRHFTRIAAEADGLPVFAYDIPDRVGTKLPWQVVLELAGDGVLRGIKDSSAVDSSLRRLTHQRAASGPSEFSIFTGSEINVDTALSLGVDGVVPGLGNLDPTGYVRLVDAVASGRLDAARAEQDRLFDLFDVMLSADRTRRSNGAAALGALKAGLYLLGVIDHPTTAFPAVPLTTREIERVRTIMQRAGLEVPAAR